MKIEHLAIWAKDLEVLKAFYVKYFGAEPNEKYRNTEKGFESYFLSFDSGARLELMHLESIPSNKNSFKKQYTGIIHFAFSVGSVEKVKALTNTLKTNGHKVIDGPRETGDGYYESVILDPEGNRVEITV